MRLFEFRDLASMEAYVIAVDHDDATELFEEHLLQHGRDPDTLMWRELAIDRLDRDEWAGVWDALTVGREGLVMSAGTDRWVFVTPVGAIKITGVN